MEDSTFFKRACLSWWVFYSTIYTFDHYIFNARDIRLTNLSDRVALQSWAWKTKWNDEWLRELLGGESLSKDSSWLRKLLLCWSFVQIISLLDPGLAEDVEDVSICSPDEHLRKRKAISLPIPTSPIVSAPSLGDSSKPVPEKQRLYHTLVVLHGLEIE